MYYKCECCKEESDRVIFRYDSARDELYLICPNCGGCCDSYADDDWDCGEACEEEEGD